VAPLFILLWLSLVGLVTRLIRGSAASSIGNPFWVLKAQVIFNTYGGLFQTLFIVVAVNSIKALHCYPNPNGLTTMVSAPHIVCSGRDDATYSGMLGLSVAAFILYVGVYGSWFIYTVLKLDDLQHTASPAYLASIRFVTARFREDVRWWGIPFMLRNMLTALV